MQQWTKEQALRWYESIPRIFGCNFLPSTAVNSTEMWQATTFDPVTIERELQFAAGLGYNSVRIFMMPILFDDCAFAGREPYLGSQDAPVPGVHNSQWTPSPGFAAADDRGAWPELEGYVTDIVGTFADDTRVLAWDLYNEPGNSGRYDKSIPLLAASFEWARAAAPTQPLTAGSFSWSPSLAPIAACCEGYSDIVSFHSYENLGTTEQLVDRLSKYERPLLCTEWLHRPKGSRFETHLPFFKDRSIGIYNWGLVIGKIQTNLNWETMSGDPNPNPTLWQHDLLWPDGEVYDQEEIAAVRSYVGMDIEMAPIEMTPETMQDLEDRGLIIRMRPGSHELIAVTVDREEFAGFGTHPDNEEFLLIGEPETNPMYLAVALCGRDEFEEKVKLGRLAPSDLVLLRCKYSDPELSFFVIRKGVPHCEAIVDADQPPATFFVTESRDLPLDLVQMRKYRLRVSRT